MTRRAREIETLLLTMFAAVPLYFTAVIGKIPLMLFHLVMAGIVIRVITGRGPDLIPPALMRGLAIAYIPFYLIDAALISRSAIAASTHLVLFISAYQPIESLTRNNLAQRLLTTALIFIAALATSTNIAIVPFVIVFGFVMFRQMIYVSHMETIRSIGREYGLAPASRAALFYLVGTVLIGAVLFPMLPRLRNPVVQGFAGALSNATTGLSDSIDFNKSRASDLDPSVVSRVWMGPEAIPFFTPLRLRGAVYDRYDNNQWFQTRDEFREVRQRRGGGFRIAEPVGFTRSARIQQRLIKGSRLFLPAGTYLLRGIPQLYEGPTRDTFMTFGGRGQVLTYEVSMARQIEPLRQKEVRVLQYPSNPGVETMALQIAGNARNAEGKAAAVERYLLRNFQYYQHPEQIGRPLSVDEFLLKERRGHCEYFAAGMVALMSKLDVPARIVGGFYGGRLNPLTGYFIVKKEDAHAWVEVWNGKHWSTYDPTPPSMRPGDAQSGLFRQYATALSDSINYYWDRYILTFGLGDQIALFAEMITQFRQSAANTTQTLRNLRRTASSPSVIIVVAVLAAMAIGALSIARRRRSAFADLASHLHALGIEVGRSMTMAEALELLRERHSDAAHELQPLVALYEEEEFSGRPDATRRRELRRRLVSLRA